MIAMNFRSEPYDLGHGYSVEFHLKGTAINVEWSPRLPAPATGRELLPAYKAARNQFLASLAPKIGGSILVVDL